MSDSCKYIDIKISSAAHQIRAFELDLFYLCQRRTFLQLLIVGRIKGRTVTGWTKVGNLTHLLLRYY